MNKKLIFAVGCSTLALPLLVILVVYLISKSEINIFDNPEFWYGYMAYLGTIVFAAVALWQNENANQTNKRIMNQQLRQKIGYFNLAENNDEKRIYGKYAIYMRKGTEINVVKDVLAISLKNVGEDIILNPKVIAATINNCDAKLSTTITAIYMNEAIWFEFINKQDENDVLVVEFSIEMQNTAGIVYIQSFDIELKKLPTNDPVTFMVRSFNTAINFKEEKNNGR